MRPGFSEESPLYGYYETMARAAYYGHIQPSEFRQLEFGLGLLLTDLVTKMHLEETEFKLKTDIELTKAQMGMTR